jgi:hypothetical protein
VEAGRDFVGVDRCVAGWQVDHRFHTDTAMVAEDHVQLAQSHRANLFHPGQAATGAECFLAEVHIDDGARPRLGGV